MAACNGWPLIGRLTQNSWRFAHPRGRKTIKNAETTLRNLSIYQRQFFSFFSIVRPFLIVPKSRCQNLFLWIFSLQSCILLQKSGDTPSLSWNNSKSRFWPGEKVKIRPLDFNARLVLKSRFLDSDWLIGKYSSYNFRFRTGSAAVLFHEPIKMLYWILTR